MNYFIFKVVHELMLTLLSLFFLISAYFNFKKSEHLGACFISSISILFNLIIYFNYPWRKNDIFPFSYSIFLITISILSSLIFYKSFSVNILKDIKRKDIIIFSFLYLFFVPLALSPIYSSPGTSSPLANVKAPFSSGGLFYIIQGGNNFLNNHHHFYHEQKYALDIVKICDKENIYKNNFANNENFCIWNEPIKAVCDGAITEVVSFLKDNIPYLITDLKNPKGNHVILRCKDGISILYAHLRMNSSNLKVGDSILTGTKIGNVGNSGNSTEPHLHIQANLNKEPLLLIFNGHSYKRNDLFKI